MPVLQKTFCDSKLLTQISGLVFDEHDNLYACNFGTPSASIVKIDKDGNAVRLTELYGNDRNFVSMVYLDNFLYVTGFNNCVYKVDSQSGVLTTFTTLADVGTNGLTFFDNHFYVVTQDGMSSGNVYKVDKDGNNTVFINKNDLLGTQYNSIVNDNDGNFYITDEGNSTVVKYSHDGILLNLTFITGTYQALLIHSDNMFITNYAKNEISQYDMNGVLINDNVACGGMTFAGGGIAVNKKGDFYCSLEVDNSPGDVSIQMVPSLLKHTHDKSIKSIKSDK